jgi:FKBP-type peptidyl-prolyl cis-trans isomerase
MSVPDFYAELFSSPPPPDVDTTLSFTYAVQVKDILGSQEYLAMQRQAYEEARATQLREDTIAIETYLKSKGLKAGKTESGIRYIVMRQGKGPVPAANQTVDVHYDGYLIDGTHFDTSYSALARQYGLFDARNPYQPYPVVIDQGTVIPGWNEALKMFNKGTRATICIPSSLAYGPQPQGELIPPNSVLLFDIEVVNIR